MEYLNDKLNDLKAAEKADEGMSEYLHEIREKHRPDAFMECIEEMRNDISEEQLAWLKSFEPRLKTLYNAFPWMKDMELSADEEQLALGLWMGAEGWDTNDRKMFEMPFAD
ncbi:MAG: hypothetical protein QXU82_03725, partial [Candidatus Aenigmatarchaeota archaeon]